MPFKSVETMYSDTLAAIIMLADIDAATNWLFAIKDMTECTAVDAELTKWHRLLAFCQKYNFIKLFGFS